MIKYLQTKFKSYPSDFPSERVIFLFASVGNLIDIECSALRPKKIKTVEFYGAIYLVEDGPWDIVRPSTSNNEILFSFINLIKLEDKPKSITFEQLMNTISLNDAINWIQKNGFPEIGRLYITDANDELDEITRALGTYYWLSLGQFRRQAVTLYLLFHLWQALLYEDEGKIPYYLQPLAADDVNKLSSKQQKLTAQVFISELINERLGKIDFRLNMDLSKPRIIFYTPSLFSAAYFQLACLITLKDKEKVGKHLKICPQEKGGCGNFFWGHGNSVYCPLCDRRTAYSRRQKRNKTSQEEQ
ncbi:MAG: hypothetical protein L5655_12070 [Thermosediminibacteraceae bacterium]|nr:hypothetical protein [Thermosediminibacteraceae bacterium]